MRRLLRGSKRLRSVQDQLRWLRSARGHEARSYDDGHDLAHRLHDERDSSGSRFFSQPGFAVLLGEGGSDPSGYDGDSGDAMARVRSAFGEDPAPDQQLGQPMIRDANYGRGAAGWTAVVEWILEAAAQGVVGLIVTAPIIAASRRFAALKARMEGRGAQFLINRGGAALIALDDVTRDAPNGSRLWLESAEEMSAVAGRPISELNHVGADPWLVFIVDLQRDLRYIRIISPEGDVLAHATTSLNELERLYLPSPE